MRYRVDLKLIRLYTVLCRMVVLLFEFIRRMCERLLRFRNVMGR